MDRKSQSVTKALQHARKACERRQAAEMYREMAHNNVEACYCTCASLNFDFSCPVTEETLTPSSESHCLTTLMTAD